MDLPTGAGLQILNAEVTRQASMISYDQLFGYLFLATLVLFPLLLFIRPARATPAIVVEAAHDRPRTAGFRTALPVRHRIRVGWKPAVRVTAPRSGLRGRGCRTWSGPR